MNWKMLSTGLGVFSIALGAAELFGARRIARTLDAQGNEGLIKGFGAREVASGVAILQAPAHAPRVWNRVLGDAMDLTALGAALRKSPRNKATWGALGFVLGAAALDAIVALGLDRQTGKTLPQQA